MGDARPRDKSGDSSCVADRAVRPLLLLLWSPHGRRVRPHRAHRAPGHGGRRVRLGQLGFELRRGNAGGRPSHCDHSKGSTRLSYLHPFDRPSDTCARVVSSGKVRPVSAAEDDVEEVLQLNRRHLQQSRRAAIEAEIRDLEAGSRRGGRWRARRLERALSELDRRTRPRSLQPWTEQWLERQVRSR